MLFVCHSKFYISIVFTFSWGHFNSQEKMTNYNWFIDFRLPDWMMQWESTWTEYLNNDSRSATDRMIDGSTVCLIHLKRERMSYQLDKEVCNVMVCNGIFWSGQLTWALGLFLGLAKNIWCHCFFNLHFIILWSLHPYATQNNFWFSVLSYSYLTVIVAGLLAFNFM